MEGKERIGYEVGLDIKVWFLLHYKKDGGKFVVMTDDFNGVKDVNGTTVISYPWDNEGMYFPTDEVVETVDEVKSLYDEARWKEGELWESCQAISGVSDSEIYDFCSKTSREWWQFAMNKWNALSDEEQKKYNQFIGFNDFSDHLMNIMAGALMRMRDTKKLEYEEGSLNLGKDTERPVGVSVKCSECNINIK